MKALSIHPYYASAIVTGNKSIECRSWKTDYRGDLLICSTAKKYHDTIPSHALGVVTLKDIIPFEKKHLKPALMLPQDYAPNMYAWILEYNRIIKPIPVKGKLSLWNFENDDLIEYIPEEEYLLQPGQENTETDPAWWVKYWKPLVI